MTDRQELPATLPALAASNQRLDAEFTLGEQLRQAGIDATRQYRYARTLGKDNRADFGFPAARLLVEVEGGIFGRGRPCPTCKRKPGGAHGSVRGVLDDIARSKLAAVAGYRVLRVTPDEVDDGTALAWIRRALALPPSEAPRARAPLPPAGREAVRRKVTG